MKITKQCICGNKITTTVQRINEGRGKFCSKKCQYKNATRPSGLKYKVKVVNRGWIKKGQTLAKGLVFNEEHRMKLSLATKGQRRSLHTEFKKGQHADEENNNWKGDKVGYRSLHNWVSRKVGRNYICDWCNTKVKRTHFANLDYKYTRDLDTWAELCPSCHVKYDMQNDYGSTRKVWSLR